MGASTGQRVMRATGILVSASVLLTALGFLKNVLAAYYFGTSRAMDTYLLALVIPDMAQYLSITGLFNFLPLFARARAEEGEEEGWRTAGRLLTFWLLLLVSALVVAALAAGVLSWVVAPGLGPEERSTYVVQTRLLLLMALAMGSARILGAVYNARKRFLVPALAEMVFQVASIGYLMAFHEAGTISLVGGMVFGGFCQLAVSAAGLWWQGVRVSPRFEPRHATVRTLVALSLPVYVANAGSKLNQIVNAAFASTLLAGAMSALQYAYMLVDILASTVAMSLSSALFPFLAEQHAEGRREDAARSLERGIVGTALIALPATAGLLVLARPTVLVLFERGSFDARSTEMTVAALLFYAPALVALGFNQILGTAYFAQGDTLTPMRLGLLRIAISLALCSLLVQHWGHLAIAFATTVGEYVKLGFMLALFRGDEQRRAVRSALRSCGRLALAVAIMAGVVYPMSRIGPLSAGRPPALALCLLLCTAAVGLGAYVVALRFAAAGEFAYFVGHLRRLLRPGERAKGTV